MFSINNGQFFNKILTGVSGSGLPEKLLAPNAQERTTSVIARTARSNLQKPNLNTRQIYNDRNLKSLKQKIELTCHTEYDFVQLVESSLTDERLVLNDEDLLSRYQSAIKTRETINLFPEVGPSKAKKWMEYGDFKQAKIEASKLTIGCLEHQQVLKDIALAEAQAGFYKEAKETAKTISAASYKISALSGIALVQAQAGLIKEAKQTFTLAKEIAVFDGMFLEFRGLLPLILAEAQAGFFKEAKETAQRLSLFPGYDLSTPLKGIALAEVRAELVNEAEETAKGISSTRDQCKVLTAIALAEAQSGLVKESRETFKLAKEMTRTSNLGYFNIGCMLEDIAIAESQAGFFKEAKETAKEASSGRQCRALTAIALAEAQAGLVKESKETYKLAKEIVRTLNTTASMRAHFLMDVAHAQMQAGFYKEAKETAKRISIALYEIVALKDIALAEAQMGLVKEAKETFKLAKEVVRNLNDRAYHLRGIARAQAQAGFFEQANETMLQVSDYNPCRTKTLKEIILIEVDKGSYDAARKTATLFNYRAAMQKQIEKYLDAVDSEKIKASLKSRRNVDVVKVNTIEQLQASDFFDFLL